MSLRLFIAVDLPSSAKDLLAALPNKISGARFVQANQYHLTLRFLGKTPAEGLPPLITALHAIRSAAFSIAIRTVGVFPTEHGKRAPTVLWAGVHPTDEVVALKREVDRALVGYPAGPNFVPHITLARLDKNSRQETLAFLAEHANLASAPFLVDRFHLYQSDLLPTGAVHTPLTTFSLIPYHG